MLFSASSGLQARNIQRVARRVLLAMLALMVAALPLLNGSFGASHDPVQNFAAHHGGHEADHGHEQPDGHAFGDGHTHAHNAGDHSHETAFLPPAALRAGTVPVDRPTTLDVAVPPPLRGARLDRPPKGLVTI